MPVVLVGIDHRTASPDLLSRVAVNADHLPEVLGRLRKSDHLAEAVVISTCMRTEVYVEAVRFHGAVHDIRAFLAELADVNVDFLVDSVFELYGDSACTHLFRVACGLESSVTGEPEVLGQVSRSWTIARQCNSSRAILNGLFRHAVEVGKRARTETAIARGVTSIGSATVAMVRQHVGSLSDKQVLLVGAGDMGDSLAMSLSDAKNETTVLVTNRTYSRAVEVAERIRAQARPIEELPQLLAQADVVLTSTSANEPVITEEIVVLAMQERSSRPLVLVDVAVPADVESSVRSIDGVTVLDMADLNSFAAAGRAERESEVQQVQAIIEEEALRYVASVNARSIVPVLAGLREKVETICNVELQRQGRRLANLDSETMKTVESMVNAVVAKLLHEPTMRLKSVAGLPEGERMAEAVRYLFDL